MKESFEACQGSLNLAATLRGYRNPESICTFASVWNKRTAITIIWQNQRGPEDEILDEALVEGMRLDESKERSLTAKEKPLLVHERPF